MSIQYVNKNCPVCGGNVVLLANGTRLCEKCHYVLPEPNWKECTTSTSAAKYCENCNTKMEQFEDGGWWVCPECGYGYMDYVGDPPKDLYSIFKSDGTANAWGALGLEQQTLTITKCEKFKIQCKEIDIEFELDADKLENIDTIVINGYKYIKEK